MINNIGNNYFNNSSNILESVVNINVNTGIEQLQLNINKQVSVENNKITNLANGTSNTDAINLSQLNNAISGISVSTSSFSSNVNANSHKITNLANGTNPGDSVNFGQLSNFIDTTVFNAINNYLVNNSIQI